MLRRRRGRRRWTPSAIMSGTSKQRTIDMKRISKFTISALASLLLLVAALGFTCTKAQKRAIVDLSLTHLVSLIGNERGGVLGDVGAAVTAFRNEGSESNYLKGRAAFEAVLARHDLSPRQLEIARTAAEI